MQHKVKDQIRPTFWQFTIAIVLSTFNINNNHFVLRWLGFLQHNLDEHYLASNLLSPLWGVEVENELLP